MKLRPSKAISRAITRVLVWPSLRLFVWLVAVFGGLVLSDWEGMLVIAPWVSLALCPVGLWFTLSRLPICVEALRKNAAEVVPGPGIESLTVQTGFQSLQVLTALESDLHVAAFRKHNSALNSFVKPILAFEAILFALNVGIVVVMLTGVGVFVTLGLILVAVFLVLSLNSWEGGLRRVAVLTEYVRVSEPINLSTPYPRDVTAVVMMPVYLEPEVSKVVPADSE